MSLDDTHERLKRFRDDLSSFVEELQHSGQDEIAAEQRLSGRWDDEFQRAFQKRYDELAEPVREFVMDAEDRFLPFLDAKIHELGGYLSDER